MGDTWVRIQTLVAVGESMFSDHAYDRMTDGGISATEVEAGAAVGVELEDYPDFHKGPSVLVLQTDSSGKPVHVVWGLRKGTTTPAVIVTAYRPDPELWSTDFRRRL